MRLGQIRINIFKVLVLFRWQIKILKNIGIVGVHFQYLRATSIIEGSTVGRNSNWVTLVKGRKGEKEIYGQEEI